MESPESVTHVRSILNPCVVPRAHKSGGWVKAAGCVGRENMTQQVIESRSLRVQQQRSNRWATAGEGS